MKVTLHVRCGVGHPIVRLKTEGAEGCGCTNGRERLIALPGFASGATVASPCRSHRFSHGC